ncbi:MAG: hypothetical protein IH870_05525 [Chloroflexi bacterium]|nr:hypothetical protein [Chloroflexota bacterium]
MADKKGTGLMMVWMDVPADKEEEFNQWYNEEHLPELLAIPGVLNAARYEAVSSGPKHLACYELESPAVVETEAFTSRKPTEWAQRIGPRVIATNLINNVYQMIYPKELNPAIASADMAPALQIGRMDIAPENSEEWNKWYSGVYVPNYEKVPGCIRGRRWNAVRGEPSYAVVYEFEHEKVSETAEWLAQRDINPDNPKMRDLMTHAAGSPGIWKKTFQL